MINIEYSNIEFKENAIEIAKSSAASIANLIQSKADFYKIFSIDDAKKQAESCSIYAKQIRERFSDLIIIAMGGAVLNPQMVISLVGEKNINVTKIHYLHNTDPFYLSNLLATISLENCVILAISNTGKTLETVALVGSLISEFQKINIPHLGSNIGEHFYFITGNSGTLHDIGIKINATIIGHTDKISGRYSGLTNVTTFAAQVAGVDCLEYLDGAGLVLKDFLLNLEKSSPAMGAIALYSMRQFASVNIGYLQQFNVFLEWYCQIIAESLGKNGGGITPIRGLGPNDQHSMFQLYLDGPLDKYYSLFYVEDLNAPSYKVADIEAFGDIALKGLVDINTANFQATLNVFTKKNFPLRRVMLKNLSAKTVGALVAHSMIEIIMLSHMMQINPFNQPGVELIKQESSSISRCKS